MMRVLTLRRAGGSVGVTIPKDMAARLHLAIGDRVLAIETADGILLTPHHPDVQTGMVVAARAAKKFRDGLNELARQPDQRSG